jgi:predicted permease
MQERFTKLRAVFRRDRLDEELRTELDAHLQMEVQGNVDRGMTEADALEVARRHFGNRTRIHESSREAWMFNWLEALMQDVRYGLRILRRSPGFTLTAVSVITLGIGANTAAFTLLDYVLLRPLPFANPDRLVMLYETQPANGIPRIQTSPQNFLDWRSMSHSFEAMGAYISVFFPVNLSGRGEPQRLDTSMVNAEVFAVLGVQPAAGRLFTHEDERVGGPNVVLLSHNLATALFGTASNAVGEGVSLDNQAHTIVGVMPTSFAFPSRSAHLWRPLRFSPALMGTRSNHILYAVARLRSGVSMEQARADMDVIAGQLQRAYPKDNARSEIAVVEMRDMVSPQSRTLVLAVFGAAFCLMLIACTNLASLLFARALVRRQEIAVRMAVGAARERLFRQLLTESLVLATIGGAIGLLAASVATPALARLVPAALPVTATPEMDWRVFAFAAALTLATSIAFSVGPAWRSGRTTDLNALRSRSPVGARAGRLRAALVLAEVVGTAVLLIGAGLLVKALWRVQAVNPGFRTEGVITLRTALPMPKYGAPAARRDFYQRVMTEARALPGVDAAAYVSYHPMETGSGRLPVTAPGVAEDPLSSPNAVIHFVTPGYFDALRIPLMRGRDVSESDAAAAPLVAVISDSLAERLWPGQDPIGRQLNVARSDRTVVGVVGHISVRSLEVARDAQIYFPAEQLGTTSTYYAPQDLVVHTSVDPATLAPGLRRIIRDADPAQAVSDLRLLEDVVALQTAARRDQVIVLGTFAGIAFLLAAVGIHGLLAFSVSVRTQEIGVRVALGAVRANILGMFLRQGIVLGVAGVALALPLAYACARGIAALLFGVEPGDPVIYVLVAVLVMLMTLAGSLRPAMRAASIDPAMTIRTE